MGIMVIGGDVVLVVDRSVRRRISGQTRRRLVRDLRRLVRAAAGPGASIELRLCDDESMKALHAAHMGSATVTDVLSFSAGPPVPGEADAPLGQIAIDWDAVARQARGPDPAAQCEEARSLIVHAVAHLLGHDHRTRTEARRMLVTERRLARRIGVAITRAYAMLLPPRLRTHADPIASPPPSAITNEGRA